MSNWYSLVENGDSPQEILQGDFLDGFTIPTLHNEGEKSSYSLITSGKDPLFDLITQNFIVLSQSCDLARPDPFDRVIICPRYSIMKIHNQKSEKIDDYWGKLRKNLIIGEYLLNKCEIPGHEFNFQVVNFREVYSIDYLSIQEFNKSVDSYIRLESPYREHMSQSFGMMFSRVGLPTEFPKKYIS